MIEKDNNSKELLYGLVLAGGKSTRMGRDKGLIKWHGKSQRYYLADLMGQFCEDVFISIRPDQKDKIKNPYKTIPDMYDDLGQYGGILSALTTYPEKSFLVVACDLPLIDARAMEYLIKNRDSQKIATSYESGIDHLPEPLCAIWEAKSKRILLKLLDEGITCPRKALIKSERKVKLVKPLYSKLTMNANTPEEAEKVKKIMKERRFFYE